MLKAVTGNVILTVQKTDETQTTTKIVVPELARQESNVGIVVDFLLLSPPPYKIGSKVIFRPHAAIKISYEEQEYLVVPENAIIARIE